VAQSGYGRIGVKALTHQQVGELTLVVMKVVAEHVDLSDEVQLEHVVGVVSQALTKTLREHGFRLPWIPTERKH
jgi:N-acyl-L-homoserine lactone synthetase